MRIFKLKKKKGKKAAVEMSVGTIVIIVLSMTMLILGLVLVRSIMCGAVNLTGEVNKNVRSEITKMFDATGGEVACIGSGDKAVTLIPGGDQDIVYCAIKAPTEAKYTVTMQPEIGGTIPKDKVNSWIIGKKTWTGTVSPGDEQPKKIIRLDIPENAPEGSVVITLKIEKEGEGHVSTQDLDFVVKRIGTIRSAMC
jgi:hypothetical protein